MTADQRFGLIIAALTLVFTVMAALLGVMIRAVIKFTRVEDRQESLLTRVDQLVKDKDAAHQQIQEQINADRAATDRRLRWLEEHLWKTSPRAR